MEARKVLKRPLLTEKATIGREIGNEYAFEVAVTANKIEIKDAIERLFDVKVTKIRTMNMTGKMKRMGAHQGRRAGWKKALVTLSEGQTLDIYEQ
jgi:large subunit ribosomal protein L23